MSTTKIFIPFNTASSKNSKQWTGRMLIKSKLSRQYEQSTLEFWIKYKEQFKESLISIEKPYMIGFHFVRKTKRKSDFQNLVQLPLDLMQLHGWLENDDMETCFPVPLKIDDKFTSYNKVNPGVYIEIMRRVE